ncbi:MAG: hypothetical protein HY071_04235 [Chloroflexi bacterium]|nr:hypothetical protein [Chloroflexota bacterium]
MKEAIERLDKLMQRLIEADQSGAGIEPLKVANELGRIRQVMMQAPVVLPRGDGGTHHWRCEACGTITHGDAAPARCPECGRPKFFAADIEQANVESGAG